MSEKNNRMTSSIARKINMDFWLEQLSTFFAINTVLVILVVATFFFWRESVIPDGDDVARRFFREDAQTDRTEYVIETKKGQEYPYHIIRIWEMCKIPGIIILTLEGCILIGSLFSTKKVRKRLTPLYEMALRTEELSKMDISSNKFVDFEQAISSVNPESPDAKVTTGDADLRSLEIAINNLLERMRESHRQQDRFVSDASHELRTPISVIQGYVNLLDRWGKEDEQILGESIEAIKNESEHMKNLIEQLLFLARGDSGRNTLNFGDFDLAETARDVYEESLMIDSSHQYVMDAEEPVMVHGDMAMIKQSMRILLQNASKYSAEGAVIKIAAKKIDGRPAYIIQDEGIGMAAGEVSQVFERFYRSDSARNSAEGGTGLGLSIAKWIVDAHKGTIEILSRPEFGTRFTIKL